MRKIILVAVFAFISVVVKAQEEVNWLTFEEAIEKNKENPKPIFIDVRADWCGMCAKMDKTTLKSENVIKRLNDNFYAVHFDFHDKRTFTFNGEKYSETSSGGKKFSSFSKYLEATGLPTLVFFDTNFKIIDTKQGYYKENQFIDLLQNFFE